jgi:hypothetical protein
VVSEVVEKGWGELRSLGTVWMCIVPASPNQAERAVLDFQESCGHLHHYEDRSSFGRGGIGFAAGPAQPIGRIMRSTEAQQIGDFLLDALMIVSGVWPCI